MIVPHCSRFLFQSHRFIVTASIHCHFNLLFRNLFQIAAYLISNGNNNNIERRKERKFDKSISFFFFFYNDDEDKTFNSTDWFDQRLKNVREYFSNVYLRLNPEGHSVENEKRSISRNYVLYAVPYNGSPADNQIDLCHVTFFFILIEKYNAR